MNREWADLNKVMQLKIKDKQLSINKNGGRK